MRIKRLAYYGVACLLVFAILADINSWWTWAHPALPIDIDF
jgi:hypothetical protein